jgi:hypothetical protein
MTRTAVEVDPRLIAFVLPGTPESVPIARLHVRTALGFHGLAGYGEDAEIITSDSSPMRCSMPAAAQRRSG